MDIIVTGRHTDISDRFRQHLDEKLAKVANLAPRTQRIDVVVSQESRRHAKAAETVEITCHTGRKVVRAEASEDDRYVAVDVALDKLTERLRRMGDKRRVHRGRHAPASIRQAPPPEPAPEAPTESAAEEPVDEFADSPVQVREKVHSSSPMSLSDALEQMELVGHDFFLYHDSSTDQPSVLYRRRGWSYGVIHLDIADAAAADSA